MIDSIWILTSNDTLFGAKELKFSSIPTFPLCYRLDLNEDFKNETNTPSNIFIDIKKKEGLSVTLFLEERVKRVKRALKSLTASYLGAEMETNLQESINPIPFIPS